MTDTSAVVLTVIDDHDLFGTVDRIVAAVGARPVRTRTPSRRSWLAAAAIVLDAQCAAGCAAAGLPRRDGVFVLGGIGAGAGVPPGVWQAAVDVGARRVCVLPTDEAELMGLIAEAVDAGPAGTRSGRVIAVVAGRGGAGASVFSGALALSARDALLIDLDPCGGGIDLLLGGETDPGLRWPDVQVQSGRLAWPAVRAVLPRRQGLSILSAARSFHEIDPGALAAMLDAGRRGGVSVVCDVPRHFTPAALSAVQSADLVVIVSVCDVRAVAATAAKVAVLRTLNPATGLVVRGPSPGGLSAREAAAVAAAPLLAAMRPEPRLDQKLEQGGLRLRPRSPLARAARQVLEVAHHGVAAREAA